MDIVMPNRRSREDLLAFLDQQVEQGIIPTNTAISRRSSIRRVLEQLTEEESADIAKMDVDDVMRKFQARSRQKYNIATIISYKSRLQSALNDFCNSLAETVVETIGRTRPRIRAVPPPTFVASNAVDSSSLAIVIRKGLAVRVENLPLDLTRAEAERISNAILTYVYPDDTAA